MTPRAANGRFRRIGERERRTPPLLRLKCERVSRGNRTRAAKARALVMAKLGELRRELGL